MNRRDYRVIMLYEFKLEHSAAEAARNLSSVFGTNCPCERTVELWFKKFASGDFDLEEKSGRGRRSSLNDQDLRRAVEANPETNTRTLAEDLGVHYSTVARHLLTIGKVKKMSKWVPHDLTDEQRLARFDTCSNLLVRHKNEPFVNRIITVDEKWVLYDNRKRGLVWVDKDAPPKTFPKPDLHPKKVMITVWWCCKGVIHYSFLQPGQPVTAESYCCDLEQMYRKLQKLWPAVVNRGGPILLQDNARPHTSQITRQKLTHLGIEVLPHPAYSPDLSPTDYHFFRALNSHLRQKQFTNLDDVECAFLDFVDSRDSSFYSEGLDLLPVRWQKCVDSDGFYFD